MIQDLRYGLRSLRRAPLVTTAAVLTLTLTIAGVATVMTLGYTLLMLAVGLFASWMPAPRAAAVPPASALRTE